MNHHMYSYPVEQEKTNKFLLCALHITWSSTKLISVFEQQQPLTIYFYRKKCKEDLLVSQAKHASKQTLLCWKNSLFQAENEGKGGEKALPALVPMPLFPLAVHGANPQFRAAPQLKQCLEQASWKTIYF